jgi:hypothetical protein
MDQWQEDELYGGMVDWDEHYDQDDVRAAEEELSYLENFDWTEKILTGQTMSTKTKSTIETAAVFTWVSGCTFLIIMT